MIRLGISGACGRMGTRIRELASKDKNFQIVVCLERKGNPSVGKTAGGFYITDQCQEIEKADILIEFTNPEATLEHLEYALKYKKLMIIGTTGLDVGQKERLREASKQIPLLYSPNMSLGVNLLFKLVDEAAQGLKSYQIKIKEGHHIHKKDAPSGTAKQIARIIGEVTGKLISNSEIEAIREDEVVGEHQILWENEFEQLRIGHSAKTRDVFAYGALLAARWLKDKTCGFYSMQDVLAI